MKKHISRIILLIGFVLLLIAIGIMIKQTIFRKQENAVLEPASFSVHQLLR